MYKKFSAFILIISLCISLSACGVKIINPLSSNDSEINIGRSVEKRKYSKQYLRIEPAKYGIYKLKRIKTNVNIIENQGPFMIEIKSIKIATFKPYKKYIHVFGNKKKYTLISLDLYIKNNSDTLGYIYPDQGVITTNSKEQVEADMTLSGKVGGEFNKYGERYGTIVFLLNSSPKKINKFSLTIDAPNNTDLDPLGESFTFKLDI